MSQITEHISARLDPTEHGVISVAIEYTFPSSLTSYSVRLPDTVGVDGRAGFTHSVDRVYLWDESTVDPRLELTMRVDETSMGGYAMVDKGSWAIGRRPILSSRWQYRGASPNHQTTVEIDGEGAASSDGHVLYLGPYQEYNRNGGDQRFRLIVPEAANLTADPAAVLSVLAESAELLDVGAKDPSVLAVAAPSGVVNWGPGGRQQGSDGFWALDNTSINSPDNTWVHEYIHTRQSFDTTKPMRWIVEGLADYYEALLPYQQGLIPFETFHEQVSTEKDERAVLANPDRWVSPYSNYYKGRRVVAALDAEIRFSTGGERTVGAVFRRMNQTDERVSLVVFERLIEEVTGEAYGAWLTEYVRGTDAPSIPSDSELFSTDSTPSETVRQPTARCPDCGTPVENEGDRCGACEESTQSSNECSVCRTAYDDDDEYCSVCGVHLHRTCPVCERHASTEQFCIGCGAQLVQLCHICDERIDRAADGEQTYCNRCGNELTWP